MIMAEAPVIAAPPKVIVPEVIKAPIETVPVVVVSLIFTTFAPVPPRVMSVLAVPEPIKTV